jgi:Tol biopolymer transport system component/predicted Ser/Thr protein kinase
VSLAPGTRLGPYEILAAIGAGGMGEVYRARDTKLNRDVAIKVLPELFALDPDRRARFTREAQTLASLNHPNIAAIYGIESNALVMELVEGEDLSVHIGRGPMPLADALPIARQIADALEAAHEQGIIHRDLKPANIKLRADGKVKVLDFGLAKAMGTDGAGAPADAMNSPTLTRGTQMGLIMGTAAYMAPEQARGKAVDKRADIWAFGIVLYEMLTGRRAFTGEEISDVLAAVLRQDIDWTVLPADTPARLRRLLERCLDRDPRQRLRDIGEARVELGRIESGAPDSSAAGAVAHATVVNPRRRVAPIALALAACALVMFAAGRYIGRPAAVGTAGAPISAFTQVTDLPGVERWPALSPDGKAVVYSKTVDGDTDLFLQRIGSRNPVRLTAGSPAADWQPAFSPDGERIAFRSERDGGGVFLMTATGESVTRLTDVGYSPSWSPDGREIVVAPRNFGLPSDVAGAGQGLAIVDVTSGQKRELPITLEALQPSWSPAGSRIVCWTLRAGGRRDITTFAADGSDAASGGVAVTDDPAIDWSPVWSPDGRALYFSSTRGGTMNVWRVPIDQRSGKVIGEFEPVTAPSAWAGDLAFSRDGTRLAYASLDYRSTLFKVPFDTVRETITGPPTAIVKGTRAMRDHQLSPDGTWVVFNEESAQEDLFVARTDGTEYRRLTDEGGRHRGPAWSPDGSRIAFYSDRSGSYELWTIRPDGSRLSQVTEGSAAASFPAWSPDGKEIAFGLSTWFRADASAAKMRPPATLETVFAAKDGVFYPAGWAPTGDRIVGLVTAPNGATSSIFVYSLLTKRYTPVPGPLAHGGLWMWPQWLADGRRLLVRREAGLAVLDAATGEGHALMSMPGYIVGSSAGLSRDNKWITYTETATEGDIWLATIKK